eukprot:scaffold109727_cov41-Tisochrysis_lutea.AAC.3
MPRPHKNKDAVYVHYYSQFALASNTCSNVVSDCALLTLDRSSCSLPAFDLRESALYALLPHKHKSPAGQGIDATSC